MSIAAVGVALLLVACGGQQEPAPPVQPSPVEPAPEPTSYRENPDFGSVTTRTVEAEGVAGSLEAATLRALDAAVAQVNGRRVTSASGAASAGIRLEAPNRQGLQVDSKAYADLIVSSSDGVVRSFSVESSEEITRTDAESLFHASDTSGGWVSSREISLDAQQRVYSRYWKVRVKAEIAQFEAPADDGSPRIVVAMPRYSGERFQVGDESADAELIAEEIRRRLADAISQSGRFALLDRDLEPELRDEIEFIGSGNARQQDFARLGQQLAADLILVPSIERFEYRRQTRKLRMSGRQLVSYSGGGVVNVRLVHATTGQVILSASFAHELPPSDASTLPRRIDGEALATEMMDALSSRILGAVIAKTFPVSIVAKTGDQVVLSQGGGTVAAGEVYDVVRLGDPLTDPQTGRSLGRRELPCCEVRVDRVSDRTAYGTLLGAESSDLSGFEAGMLELRERTNSIAPPAPIAAPAAAQKREQVAATVSRRAAPPAPAPSRKAEDDPDW